MNLVSIRLITDDIEQLVGFYQRVTGVEATWATPDFAEIVTPVGTLAIGSVRTVPLFGAGSARPADNHTAIIEFMVPDVDADYRRLRDSVDGFVNEPTTMPWGNRSLLLRDPDGNLINLFTPVTAQAVAKLAS
ncbi:VOC family protein [Nocardia salmonicida]|uniref:VOC family protein n=1 Tax=Nocardia salmonicida TaxID=53431 RepID=UPI002E2B5C52|nr:VOC family protein [Nocardia salmonicida]